MPSFISAIDEYVARVKLIEAAGISLPKEWVAVHQRLLDYQAMTTPSKDRLVAAVIDRDSDADVVTLRANAYAEAEQNSNVNAAVIAGVHAKLHEVYRPHAARIYGQLAKRFDQAAQRFTAAATVVDPESDSDPMVTAPADQRAAWTEAPLLATELSELLPALRVAAHFCGVELFGKQSEPTLLALVVDPAGAHRRRLWSAWETRTGREPVGRSHQAEGHHSCSRPRHLASLQEARADGGAYRDSRRHRLAPRD
ncbi:hypothetical protein [Mycobacterium sp. MMS18-G62]